MKLETLFDSSFNQVDRLIHLHDELVTASVRAVRPEWRTRFFAANLSKHWKEPEGLWRSRGRHLIIVGKDTAQLDHTSFSAENMGTFLRMALVLGMSAVDKVFHEAISNRFMYLLHEGYFDRIVEMPVSTSYEIAIGARERRGKGGKVKARPGHKVKDVVMASIYRDSFLSCRKVEELSSALGASKIFTKFGTSLSPQLKYKAAHDRWQRIYDKRNAIVHEMDIIRMKKPQSVRYHEAHPAQYKSDIDYIRRFGKLLSTQLK